MLLPWILAGSSAVPVAMAQVAEPLSVWIESPAAGAPTFGEIEIAAGVRSSARIVRIEFFIDGESVGELLHPPFRMTIDVGWENRERRYEVEARDARGEVMRAVRVTPSIAIDLEVGVTLHEVYVTALRGREHVLDLGEQDFVVLDDGVPQPIVTFTRGDVRLVAAILVDASLSMRGAPLRSALRGAASFARGLTAEDDATILLFSDRLLHSTPFTSDAGVLTAGLAGVDATGGTALNDHLYLAIKRLETQLGRRVVILLSDGIDPHSALRMQEVAWLARHSRALIYWIRPGAPVPGEMHFSSWKGPEQYREEYRLLTKVVEDSGGRIVTIAGIEQADVAFQEIFRELRNQYILAFQPANLRGDGRWRRLEVRARPPGVRVRAPAGYLDQ
jgi:Ca-activated chloride channel family protein